MNDDSILPTRLKADAPGLGQADESQIEKRAIELAKSDGRDAFTDADLSRAAEELGGNPDISTVPEVEPAVDALQAWDETPDEAGHRVEARPLEDDVAVAEKLIADGLDEADHDLRSAAEQNEQK